MAASKVNQDYDDEHDTLTITIACVDELGVQLNSRSFRDNIDPTFLSTLLCCRHYYISLYGSAQRFGHVDKLMRDVTLNVIQCRKFWRLQCNSWYDAWELENVTSPELDPPTPPRLLVRASIGLQRLQPRWPSWTPCRSAMTEKDMI
ncbi:MAG: hypothetical protein ACLRYE_08355 [Gemmiger formicilis]|uniref:hypothetical protein n=1 Tax=Gemmiger formicilis TaxID=745368 RepID=UPI0039A2A4D1